MYKIRIYNIFDVIRKISDSSEEMIILKYENIMLTIIASPILLLGSISNFLGMHFIWKEDINITLVNSFLLFIFYLAFELFSRIIQNEKLKSLIFTLLFSSVLVFIVIRYYHLMGAAVWTISMFLIMLAMVRLKKSMLILISLTTLLIQIYIWYEAFPLQMGKIYYAGQTCTFLILAISTFYVHKINTNRCYQINKQFHEVTKINEEITSLNKEIKLSENKVKYLAYHDHLTGLPNRLFLSEQLNHAISLASRTEKMIATMFLDLDDFKMINDTMGHDIGDELLVEVSKRLVSILRKCDTVARIGGDEFIMVIENVENIDYIKIISEKIIECFNKPFRFNDQECFVTTSLGVAIYPVDGENAEVLIKNADISMYKAKGNGKNKYVLCTPVMKTTIIETMKMTNFLHRALIRNELELYYQPQVSCTSNEIVGLEALIRWNHPILGMILPGEFIPIAEQTGLIIPIGDWVLRTACKQNKMWQNAGLPRIRIGVNLSAKQFQNDHLAKDVDSILTETGLDYKYLELEITESAAMKGKGYIVETLKTFRKSGIHIAIDDFGTEYSSLNYLKQLPADRIKIPMTFIKGIDVNTEDSAITKAIIILAKNMGLGVIAEGVETKKQLNFLNQIMCDEIQGFYYFKPMPVNEVEKLLRKPLAYNLKNPLQ